MAKILHERWTRPFRGVSLALLRAAIVALGLSGVAFSAAGASNKVEHLHRTPFREFIDALWPLAEERGVSRATFDSAFAGVAFDPKVVASARIATRVRASDLGLRHERRIA